MDVKVLATVIVGAIIGVLLLTSIVVPIVSSSTSETATYVNEGVFYTEADEDTHTIVMSSAGLSVDGEVVDTTKFPAGSAYPLLLSDEGYIMLDTANSRLRWIDIANVNYPYASETVTVSLAATTATISSSDTTLPEKTLANVDYYVSTAGDYVLSATPTVLADSVIYNGSTTAHAGVGTMYYVYSGTISDLTGSIVATNPSSLRANVTITSTTATTTDLGNGLYRIDSVGMAYTAVVSDTPTDLTSVPDTYMLAPSEIVYDNPNYVGSNLATILSIIPVFIAIAIVFGVMMLFSRRE